MKYLLLFLLIAASAAAEEHRFRMLGIFQPDRVADLKAVVEQMDGVVLVRASFETAEATFEFADENLALQFDQQLRGVSKGTFEALPPSTIPAEKLEEVKIPILGLDCKGCSYGAYLAVYKVEGVERATASFRDGHVIAQIDPEKTDRAALEEALTKRRVTLKDKAAEAN